MIQLVYKIAGDTNPIKQSLNQLPAEAGKAGSETGKVFAQQMKAGVMRFIGAGAIISLINKQIKEAKDISTEATKFGLGTNETQALTKAAAMTGLSPEEVLARGRKNPAAFSALMKGIEEKGGLLDERTVRDLSTAGEKLDEIGTAAGIMFARTMTEAQRFVKAGYYGGVAGASAASGMIADVTGNERMRAASRSLYYESQAGAESLIAGEVATPIVEAVSDVKKAIQDLQKTVDEKL